MKLFNFDYNSSVKRIRCIYTYDGIVSDNTYWEGYIITENVDGLLNIKGYERDGMDSLGRDGEPHLRYIFGNRAISYANETLSFEIYPCGIAPIHYDMHYNQDDGCFYGDWHFVPSKNHPHSASCRIGEAIIRIEETSVDKKEVSTILRKLSNRNKRIYSEEMEYV